MNVNPVTGATASFSTPASASSGALTSDFETFLKLMTTQLQFQDPLNPVDSTEYLSQLASFSAVEQQTRTNSILESLKSSFDLFGTSQAASWVGREARAAIPAEVKSGEAVTLSPSFAPQADSAVMVVRDANGQLVNRVEMSVGAAEYVWQPLDITGAALPDGFYTLSIENFGNGVQLDTTTPELYARISEVQALGGEAVLVFSGGREVSASRVSAIRG